MKKILIAIIIVGVQILCNACSFDTNNNITFEEISINEDKLAASSIETVEEDAISAVEQDTRDIEPFFEEGIEDSNDGSLEKRMTSKHIWDPGRLIELANEVNKNHPDSHCEFAMCLVRPTEVDTVKRSSGEAVPLYTFEIVDVLNASCDTDSLQCLKKGNVVRATDIYVYIKSGTLYNSQIGNIPIVEKNALYLIALSYSEKLDYSYAGDKAEEIKAIESPYNIILHGVYTPGLKKEMLSREEIEDIFEGLKMSTKYKEQYKEYIYKYAEGMIA